MPHCTAPTVAQRTAMGPTQGSVTSTSFGLTTSSRRPRTCRASEQRASQKRSVSVRAGEPSAGWLRPGPWHVRPRRGAALRTRGFGDELLDFINAGPKMRKWYGEGELLPRDGGGFGDEVDEAPPAVAAAEAAVVRDSVLVTDADSATGELVVLRLILAREKIRVLVRDVAAAKMAYGAYVTPIAGDVGDSRALAAALIGARAAVVTGKLGELLPAAQRAGLEHLVVLSCVGAEQGAGFSLGGLLGGEGAVLRDPKREAALAAGGVCFTLVRAGAILDTVGGASELTVSPAEPSTSSGSISREDVASVLVGALSCLPATSLTVQVSVGGLGSPPEDWAPLFAPLQQQATSGS